MAITKYTGLITSVGGLPAGLEAQVETNKNDIQDLTTIVGTKQDILTAGTGITITNNVISATGGSGNSLWEIAEQTLQNLESLYTGVTPQVIENREFVGAGGKKFYAKKSFGLTNVQTAKFFAFNTFRSSSTTIPYYVSNIIATSHSIIQDDNTTLSVYPILELGGYDIDGTSRDLYITEILKNYDVTGGVIPVIPPITQAEVTQITENKNNITSINTKIVDLLHEYHFTTNILSTLNNTTANPINLSTVLGSALFNKILADPERYRLSFQVQAGAGDDNIAVGAVGYGLNQAIVSKPNGNLFTITGGAQYSPSKAQTDLNPIYLQFMVQTDGTIYFNTKFNNAWNANFIITRIHIEEFTV